MTRFFWVAELSSGVAIHGYDPKVVCKSVRDILGKPVKKLEVWDFWHQRKVKDIEIPHGAKARIFFRKYMSPGKSHENQVFGWIKPDYKHLWEFSPDSPTPKFVGGVER